MFENRNEPNFPKSDLAQELINKIIKDNNRIIISDNLYHELFTLGYSHQEIKDKFMDFRKILIFVNSTKKEIGKARDLSFKRKIPKRDALHALIARNNKAIMITFDRDFNKIKDIIISKTPREII